jgi:hypothetical protein
LKRRRKTEIKIERLTEQLESRIPKGRDLTGHQWLETLAIASTTAPKDQAVIDGTTGEVIAYRSIKQLLGDNYKLLNRQRQQKRSSSPERHKAQKKAASNQFGESELGQYLDRLLAQAIGHNDT